MSSLAFWSVKCSGFSIVLSLVAVAEQPGRAVVGRRAGVGLDLDEEQAAGGRDEQVDLADVAAGGGEREGLPGPVRLGFRHLRPDVVEGVLFPGEAGPLPLPARRLPGEFHAS